MHFLSEGLPPNGAHRGEKCSEPTQAINGGAPLHPRRVDRVLESTFKPFKDTKQVRRQPPPHILRDLIRYAAEVRLSHRSSDRGHGVRVTPQRYCSPQSVFEAL